MNEITEDELKSRTLEGVKSLGDVRATQAVRDQINSNIEHLKNEGKLFVMTPEEQKMLISFRAFKSKMRRSGEVFKWQTTKPGEVSTPKDAA